MIPRIVLTGGPCGGKSTALTFLRDRLPVENITPIFVPELATTMFNSGIRWRDVSSHPNDAFRFQANMIRAQIQNEDMFYSFAHLVPNSNKVLICDRGTIDNMVYAVDDWHEDILSQVGSLGMLKRRYDGVIHLNSLAWGEGYSLDNPARFESREDAIKVDERTWQMWNKGPIVTHYRISHEVSLDVKMERVAQYVIQICNEAQKHG
jgi:AAA domain-containing protein